MNDPPLVSVVLPTRERPSLLNDAIESIRSQQYEPIELVVVDGSPSETTRDRVHEARADLQRTRYVPQTDSTGAAAARNLGIGRASGSLIAFLDDDDRWEPAKLAEQVPVATADSVGLVYTGMRFETGDRYRGDFNTDIAGNVTRDLLRGNFIGSFSRVLVDASVVDDAGPIDERFEVWEDWEWYVRLSRHCSVAVVPEPLTVRRGGHGTRQLSHDIERMFDDAYPLFVAQCRPIAAEYGWRFERRFLGSVNFRLGWAALMRGEYGYARRALLRAVYWYPASVQFLAVLVLALGGPTVRRLYETIPDSVTARVGRHLRRWS